MFVSYCDIWGGQQFAFIRPPLGGWKGGTLIWQPDPNNPDESTNMHGTSLNDPIFVGIDGLGENYQYYLSHNDTNDANQVFNSPCIDRGTGDANDLPLGRYRYSTRTDSKNDVNALDIGFHYYKNGRFEQGDLDFDSVVDNNDAIQLMLYWLQECTFPGWCDGADLNLDGFVNFADLAILSTYWGAGDVTPPSPDPMTWEILPASNSQTTVSMTATQAFDNSGQPVQYYFKCVSGGGHDRDWSTDRTYTDTGLAPNVEYGYKVKARDITDHNTAWSFPVYAVTGEDTTPPSPNPMQWYYPPSSSGPTSITMTAVTATDNYGGAVEYFFERYSGGPVVNSGWQASTTWTDLNLTIGTTYSYRVKARDVKADPNFSNETDWSPVMSAAPGVDQTPPVPNPMTWEVPPAGNGGSGITMVATQAFDSSGSVVEYYFENLTDSNHNRDWSTNRTYIDTGLTPSIAYFYRVQARDASDNRTQWSEIRSAQPNGDLVPPIPNPMDWTVSPTGYTDTSIIMKAVDANDLSGSNG